MCTSVGMLPIRTYQVPGAISCTLHFSCTNKRFATLKAAAAQQNRAGFPVDPSCMLHVTPYLSEIRERDARRVSLSAQDRHSTGAS